MSTRGWENFTQTDVTRHQLKQSMPKQSKYKNVKTVVDGETFDSKREASAWMQLKAQQELGDISNLERQKQYPLYCPSFGFGKEFGDYASYSHVAVYIADFVYDDKEGKTHVVDVKGGKATRTQVYLLKRKWLELQSGVVIEEL